MRNLNNVEINTVAGGEVVCGIQVLKNEIPAFNWAPVTNYTSNGKNVTVTPPITTKDMELVVGFMQKLMGGKKNHISIGTDGIDKWSLISVCTTTIDNV